MKKFTVLITALMVLIAIGAASAQQVVLDVKAGTAYASDSDIKKWGFNSNVEVGVAVNPYLSLVAIPGFTMFSWDVGTGLYKTEGTITSELKANIDAYCFPILAGAKINLVDVKESLGITPYITAAAGYTWMKYSYDMPSYTIGATEVPAEKVKSTYKGLTWEALIGFNYLFPDTNMALALEGGYRGMKLKKGDFEVDMSGYIINIGASFAFGEEM